MKLFMIFCLIIFVFIILVLIYKLFFLSPKSKFLFKKSKNKIRVSMSYAVLFDLSSIAKLIKNKMIEGNEKQICISTFNVTKCFNNLQSVEKDLISFQDQLIDKVLFNIMYYKNWYEELLEIWINYSRNNNYRKTCLKLLFYKYKRKEIYLIEFMFFLRKLCHF